MVFIVRNEVENSGDVTVVILNNQRLGRTCAIDSHTSISLFCERVFMGTEIELLVRLHRSFIRELVD